MLAATGFAVLFLCIYEFISVIFQVFSGAALHHPPHHSCAKTEGSLP